MILCTGQGCLISPDFTDMLRLKIAGWINYYGKFRKSEIGYMFSLLDNRLARWAKNKYGRFKKMH